MKRFFICNLQFQFFRKSNIGNRAHSADKVNSNKVENFTRSKLETNTFIQSTQDEYRVMVLGSIDNNLVRSNRCHISLVNKPSTKLVNSDAGFSVKGTQPVIHSKAALVVLSFLTTKFLHSFVGGEDHTSHSKVIKVLSKITFHPINVFSWLKFPHRATSHSMIGSCVVVIDRLDLVNQVTNTNADRSECGPAIPGPIIQIIKICPSIPNWNRTPDQIPVGTIFSSPPIITSTSSKQEVLGCLAYAIARTIVWAGHCPDQFSKITFTYLADYRYKIGWQYPGY